MNNKNNSCPGITDKLAVATGEEKAVSESSKNTTAKSKLMADLFSDKVEGAAQGTEETKSSSTGGSKKDKKKLMADLFGGDEDSSSKRNTKSPIAGDKKDLNTTAARQDKVRKTKDDITFDEDDDLLGGLGEPQKKHGPISNSPKGGSFLDSLLSKSSTSEQTKSIKEKSVDFVLDNKYKSMNKRNKDEDIDPFGGYAPSASKSSSPRRRLPKKSLANDNFDIDLYGDSEPRTRHPRSAVQRKPLEIDDDDILGSSQSNIRGSREKSKIVPKSVVSPGEQVSATPKMLKKSPMKSSKKDEWLFDNSGTVPQPMNNTSDDTPPAVASVHEVNDSVKKSPSKNRDWLGNLLSSNKNSPSANNQVKNIASLVLFVTATVTGITNARAIGLQASF